MKNPHNNQKANNINPKIVRINLAKKIITYEPLTPTHPYFYYAGKSLTSKIIASEVPPLCEPLGSDNKLIIACGFLTGTTAPNSGRGSIGAKSPLTNGLKESNIGSRAPAFLARNNIRALILEQKSSDWVLLKVSEGKVEIIKTDELVGLNNYALSEKLLSEYGKRIGTFSIGLAGEQLFSNSSIAGIDMEGYPSRHAGRGGLGAVMGSKKVKAIIVESPQKSFLEYADPSKFKEFALPWFKNVSETNKNSKRIFGTAGSVSYMNEVHSLPTKNYHLGQFDKVNEISGEKLNQILTENQGKFGIACSPGCAIRCSNIVRDSNGNHITSSLEYETIGMLGSNILNGNLIEIGKLDHLCDDLGLDTIETGACFGILMELGKIKWGDSETCIKMLKDLSNNRTESRDLGLGVFQLGKKYGIKRIPHVKGQSFPAYDARALKGIGVTFLSSPMGADHTAGDISGPNPHDFQGKIKLSQEKQIFTYLLDSMGICYFVGTSLETTNKLTQLLNARYGSEFDKDTDFWIEFAKNCLVMERDFNTKAGLSAVDHFPEFMKTESLEDEPNLKWKLDQDDIESFWNFFLT